MKFVIYAAGYNDDIGGLIVLHKLCDLLNRAGHEAYLYPVVRSGLKPVRRTFAWLTSHFPFLIRLTGKGFRLNPSMNTPLAPPFLDLAAKDVITVYGETVSGNPLKAGNIVRWFLHKPGFHTGEQNYGEGEFHVDFNEFLAGYDPGPNYLSRNRLHVVHFPFEIYNLDGADPPEARTNIAYCLRKGELKPGFFDIEKAICIDGLSHPEIAAVFKTSQRFVSFDAYTAYSQFAALCGATSIVIPPADMEKSDWYAEETYRYGVAFGMDELDWARETRDKVLPHLTAKQNQSLKAVTSFAEEVGQLFSRADN